MYKEKNINCVITNYTITKNVHLQKKCKVTKNWTFCKKCPITKKCKVTNLQRLQKFSSTKGREKQKLQSIDLQKCTF